MRRALSFGGAALAAALAMGAARADTPEAEAERHLAEGRKLHAAGKLAEARAQYRKALEHVAALEVVCNLGAVEQDLGDSVAAAPLLARCLDGVPLGDREKRQRVQKVFDLVKGKVGTLTLAGLPEHVPGTVQVGDGPKQELRADRVVWVPPGAPVRVVASVEGKAYEGKIQVAAGGAETLRLGLVAPPPEGVRPPAPPPPPAADDAPVAPWKTPLAITGVAAGLVGLGAGIGLVVASSLKNGDGDKLLQELGGSGCPAVNPAKCKELLSVRQDQDLFFNVGLPVLVTGGVLLAGGIVTAVIPVGAKKAAALELRPGVGGAVLRGRF